MLGWLKDELCIDDPLYHEYGAQHYDIVVSHQHFTSCCYAIKNKALRLSFPLTMHYVDNRVLHEVFKTEEDNPRRMNIRLVDGEHPYTTDSLCWLGECLVLVEHMPSMYVLLQPIKDLYFTISVTHKEEGGI